MTLAIARHFRPRRAVPRRTTWETRTDPTWIESLLTESVRLNQTGRSFTRATSAWDPIHNCILAPGKPRQVYARYKDRVSIPLDLPEGPRTNLLAAGSSEFQSGWSNTRSSLIAAQWTAPNGESALMLAEDSTASQTHMVFQSVNITTTLPYTISVMAKANTRSVIILQFGSTAFSGVPTAWFDLSAGAVSKTSGSPTATSITAVPGQPGVYRCTMTATSSSTAADSIFCYLDISPTGSGVYSGQGNIFGAFVWGASLEQAAFPSSFISTRNLHIQSNNFANAAWTKTDTTILANQVANPLSGLVDVALFTEGSAGTADVFNAASVTVVSGGTYTASRYFKAGTATFIVLQISNGAITSGFRFWANISTGVAGTFSAFGTGTTVSSSITAVPGWPGWYRVVATGTIGAFTGGVTLTQSATANGVTTRASGSTRYEANTQLEPGTSPTFYWATDATVGGRDGENLTCTYALGTAPGTIVAIMSPVGWTGNAGGTAFLYDDSTTSGIAGAYILSTGICHSRRKDANGVEDSPGPSGTPTAGAIEVVGSVWTASALTCSRNGVAGTPASLTPPLVASAGLQIGGSQGATNPTFGYVALLTEPRAWTALELNLVGQYANLVLGNA